MLIFVIDMLNHLQVYVGMDMSDAVRAKNEYMSFMGITDDSILMEAIINDN